MAWSSQNQYFETIIPAILNWEGGKKLVDHPRDPGGKTKYGISERYNAATLQKMGTTIKDLTEDQARQIYYEHYFLPSGCDAIRDIGIILIHFDAAVNHGVGAANKMLNSLSSNPAHFAGDGLNKALFNELSLEYLGLRQQRYCADPNDDVFLEGWINRLSHLITAHVQLNNQPNAALLK